MTPGPTHVARTVLPIRDGAPQAEREDVLAEEVPIALEYNGISHATVLATPAYLADFARGFSLTEGIVRSPADIRGIDVIPRADGVVVQLEIAAACEMQLKARRRAMAGRTGCGLCGVETLDQVVRPVPPLGPRGTVSLAAIQKALGDLRAAQPLHQATGATHAAAWADASGALRCVREDVGRHNALDKLIGAMLGEPREGAFAVVSSRASFEMVQKCVAAGIDTLVAVSAPTALAVRLAEEAGLLLVGFARGATASVYAHRARLDA